MTHKEYKHSEPLSNDFHTYGLYWNATTLYTYIDSPDKKVLNLAINDTFWNMGKFEATRTNPWSSGDKNAPFDQSFYIILNLAAGGTNGYFQEGVAGKPWSNNNEFASRDFYNAKGQWKPTWTQDFQIDWVKVYSLGPNGT